MQILIIGGTGFIGSALVDFLAAQEHQIVIKTRDLQKATTTHRYITDFKELTASDNFDVVINLSGEPIANKRWSGRQKRRIRQSRIATTQGLIDYLQSTAHKPTLLINSSAIGYYGIVPSDAVIDENAEGDQSFSSQLCVDWEQTAQQAQSMGIRTCLLRTGIVLGANGGALAKMLPVFRYGLGGRIGSGSQWMPWIHVQDFLGIVSFCMHQPTLEGAINCTAPNPETNAQFSKLLASQLKRPALVSMPGWLIKLLMGQMGEELLLSGKKVLPTKLLNSGFAFQFERLDSAFKEIL